MSPTIKIAVLGVTGETGASITQGLIDCTEISLEITALVREESIKKPLLLAYAEKGVKIVVVDIDGPISTLTAALDGIDVVISAVGPKALLSQIHVADACKAAGVGRFVPCNFATVAPPTGILMLRDIKEQVINHIKMIRLPYTVIDVGWWYQNTLPRLPSGKIDYALLPYQQSIAGDGNTKYAITDISDIGKFTARIVIDPRTLNHYVFAYGELKTQNEIFSLIESLSGETVERTHVSAEEVAAAVVEGQGRKPEIATREFYELAVFQYLNTWGIRGDNEPGYAKYLGYLLATELYPEMKGKPFLQYCNEVLEGKAHAVYKDTVFF